MERVLRTDRVGDGVSVAWEEGGREMTAHFTFARLIELSVNALDLLNNPGHYGIDGRTGEVRYIAFCQPSRHPELQE